MNIRYNKVAVLILSVLTVSTISLPVLALESPDTQSSNQTTSDSSDQNNNQTNKQTDKQVDRMVHQTRLADKRLKSCQEHEKDITHIITRVSDRGQKQLDLFSTIANKTETFYTNKGNTLSNYDTLVADVASKKVIAQAAVEAVTSTGVQFKCDGTDPKGVASSFKEQLKAEIVALKSYKTSVRDLIKGVKSVQTTTDTTNKDSAGGAQ